MKVAELLERRKKNWRELEELCNAMSRSSKRRRDAAMVSKFAALYRAACADLALADAYQLPPNTVQFLHLLVGRAHNQLYRSQRFNVNRWRQTLLEVVPRQIFEDRCVQICFVLFWGIFILSAFLAQSTTVWPGYAEQVMSAEFIEQLESMFANEINGRPMDADFAMAGFYILHNTGIGLQCFAGGILVVPGIYITVSNAALLGASFGYMARPDVPAGENFFHFVTAHGPFELTAIVLAAGAGLRIGWSWIRTDGLTRHASLRKAGQEAMPVMGASMVLFFFAALIEGFLSPSAAPYYIKAMVAIASSALLMVYFVVLGMPRRSRHALR
ncbi:MAG: stage II sporulation protein M [Pirellulaceae bacterium]